MLKSKRVRLIDTWIKIVIDKINVEIDQARNRGCSTGSIVEDENKYGMIKTLVVINAKRSASFGLTEFNWGGIGND